MSIGGRIKECRERLGLTQEELAKAMGVSKGTVGNYEANISYPKIENMTKLFELLKTDANYIFQDDLTGIEEETFSQKERAQVKKYRTLDKYGKKAVDDLLDTEYERCTYIEQKPTIEISLYELPASAGTGEFLSDEMSKIITIPDTPLNRSADFIVQVNGESMLPDYDDDDYLLVRKQETVNEGEIGIFVLNGCGYVKIFGGDRLISINDKYDDISFGEYDNIVCYGKVVGKV